jgi:SAP domain/RNSP1-SAP18 binding (RSB) motif
MVNLDKESAKLLKVDELKAALKARRCSISGKKADLYDRLVAFLDDEESTQGKEEIKSSEELSNDINVTSSEVADIVKSTDDADTATKMSPSGARFYIVTPKFELLLFVLLSFIRHQCILCYFILTKLLPFLRNSETEESVANTADSNKENGVSTGPAAIEEKIDVIPSLENAPGADNVSADNNQITGSNEITSSSEITESSVAHPSSVEVKAVAIESSIIPNEAIDSESISPLQNSTVPHVEEKTSKLSENEEMNVEADEMPTIPSLPQKAAILEEVATSADAKQIAVETEVLNLEVAASVVDDGPPGGEFHVRIDNFQRPLTDKLLFEWLAKVLGHEVAREKLWMNKIKTHCYIDFETLELANACIAAVTGQKVDDKHSLHLVAASTDVSSKDAENSIEGKLKPNEWKNSKMQKLSGSELSGIGNQHGIPPKIPAAMSMAAGPIDMIKKAAYSATNSVTKIAQPNQNILSESIQGNIQVGFSTKRNSSGAGLTNEMSKRPNLGTVPSPFEVARKEDTLRKVQNQDFNDTVELDTLFRKTVALPPLYWLPVPDHIVELRKNSH